MLIVEDDPKASETIRLYAAHEGFDCLLAADGEAGLRMAREQSPAVVVLDLMLPRMDGLALCRALRSESSVPVLMVTARSGEADKLRGLGDGADDYLTKPFSPRELMARVRAVLRRTTGLAVRSAQVLRGGRIRIDFRKEMVAIDGSEVRLTPTEFRILALLAQSDRVWTRDEILARAAARDSEAGDRTVDAHVRNLRRKLALSGERRLIATAFGRGYQMDP
jgi:DNA-binding response OmpR family regulator